MNYAIDILPWLAAGGALGAVYLFLIGRSVAAVGDTANWWSFALPLFLRVILAAAGFWFAARHGALPLISMLGGFLVARGVALRRAREG